MLVYSKDIKILNILDARTDAPVEYRAVDLVGLGEYYRAAAFVLSGSGESTAVVNFFGRVFDPVKNSGRLRFVSGDFTRGIISKQGIYLGRVSGWYPDTPDSMAKYRVKVTLPPQYDAVAGGNLVSRERGEKHSLTIYDNPLECDGLDLVGGVYSVSSQDFDGITVETFFHPEDKALAPAYIEAAGKYIAKYSKLLGTYPYERFSIVSKPLFHGIRHALVHAAGQASNTNHAHSGVRIRP
ncbi:MAG: hypothetical protein U5N86_01260 [Planctomycetota bacterium]|nr:hypothetical protein [Planctomycetota bacterium]